MKKFFVFLLFQSWFLFPAYAQKAAQPDSLWQQLFVDVQMSRAIGDNKTFVDMVPRENPSVIISHYRQLKIKDSASLNKFVNRYFMLPAQPHLPIQTGLPVQEHLQGLWKTLTRKADESQEYSSLLPLPYSYVVPGGRFREVYYWDSYFTMLGLAVSQRFDLIENMLRNFRYLVNVYGHIPNGNRSYYLSRSQPPFFALMVELLALEKGDSIYQQYFDALQKEYRWWMDGQDSLLPNEAYRRVVRLNDGSILNRYFDDKKAPREESFYEDVHTQRTSKDRDSAVFTNLRAGAESGWDFSSRWFADTLHLKTIETTDIIPVDLNALLFAYEKILAKAAAVSGLQNSSEFYKVQSQKRRQAVLKYCWNADLQFFFDYEWKDKKTTNKWSAAAAMPLFTGLADFHHAEFVAGHLEKKFLKPGGIVTTLYTTGQQWDAPNGWPPLQFVAVQGLMNYGYYNLPREIANRWMQLNEKVFAATGKMMEKYNVVNLQLEGGGGEYPTQDGFGWTNGVYLKFFDMFKRQKP